ncbi:MAG: hypothetical protein AB1725_09815, partial [Armatimonadota bacterium]
MNIPLSLLAVVLLVAGCGSSKTAPTDGEAANKPDGTTAAEAGGEATETVGTLTGPGGSVSLGDAPEKFEAAFPRPEGATDPQNPAVEDLKFVGWQTQAEVASAAVRANKIVALFHAKMSPEQSWFESARSDFGKPEHDVENDLGAFTSWRQGKNEYIVMLFKGQTPMTIQATGESATLKVLQLDSAQIAGDLKTQGEAAAAGEGA